MCRTARVRDEREGTSVTGLAYGTVLLVIAILGYLWCAAEGIGARDSSGAAVLLSSLFASAPDVMVRGLQGPEGNFELPPTAETVPARTHCCAFAPRSSYPIKTGTCPVTQGSRSGVGCP